MTDYTDNYKNLLIKQYWNKSNAAAEIELKSATFERIYDLMRSFETEFDLDLAYGDRLYKIGKIVGINKEDLEPYFDLFFGFDDNSFSLPMGYKFSNTVSVTPTGTNWSAYSLPQASNYQSVCYNEDTGRWIAVTYDGTYRTFVSDDDGETWSAITTAPVESFRRIIYIQPYGRLIAVAHSGVNRVYTSDDNGETWINRTTPNSDNYQDIAYSESLEIICAVSTNGSIISSVDGGITWSLETPAEVVQFNSICWSSKHAVFVVVGNSGSNRIEYSTDGSSWTTIVAPELNNWQRICENNGLFVSISADGTNRVMYSDNVIDWTSAKLSENNTMRDIAYCNDSFIAVSEDGVNKIQVADKSDVSLWTTYLSPSSVKLYGIGASDTVAISVPSDNGSEVIVSAGSRIETPVSINGGKFYDRFYTNTIPGVLTDDEFRYYIRAKISINSASGYMVSDEHISIQQIIQYLFDGFAIVLDNQRMQLTLEVEDSVEKGRVLLARDLNLLPRPQGVEYNSINLAGYDYFGFDDDPNALGFGDGSDVSIGGIFAEAIA